MNPFRKKTHSNELNPIQGVRTGITVDEIKQAFLDNLRCGMGRLEDVATKHDLYFALALTIRDRVFQRTVESLEYYGGADARRVATSPRNICPARLFPNIF